MNGYVRFGAKGMGLAMLYGLLNSIAAKRRFSGLNYLQYLQGNWGGKNERLIHATHEAEQYLTKVEQIVNKEAPIDTKSKYYRAKNGLFNEISVNSLSIKTMTKTASAACKKLTFSFPIEIVINSLIIKNTIKSETLSLLISFLPKKRIIKTSKIYVPKLSIKISIYFIKENSFAYSILGGNHETNTTYLYLYMFNFSYSFYTYLSYSFPFILFHANQSFIYSNHSASIRLYDTYYCSVIFDITFT